MKERGITFGFAKVKLKCHKKLNGGQDLRDAACWKERGARELNPPSSTKGLQKCGALTFPPEQRVSLHSDLFLY